MDDDHNVVLHIDEGPVPEEDYEGECGYSLIKMLRGRTVGRRIKRELFKLSLFQFVVGSIMMLITIVDQISFSITPYFTTSQYGSSLLGLQYSVALFALIFAVLGFMSMKYWASLVTNRELLGKLLRVYCFLLVIFFAVALWCLCVIFLTFKSVDWNKALIMKSVYRSYVVSVLVMLPYVVALLLYGMNISYYVDQMDFDGDIEEPDADPSKVFDLSGISLIHFVGVIVAIPCILCLQCKDAGEGFCGVMSDWIDNRRRVGEQNRRKRKSLAHRVKKTLSRWWRDFRDIISSPARASTVVPTAEEREPNQLRALNPPSLPPEPAENYATSVLEDKRREQEERERQEKAAREAEEAEEEARRRREEEEKRAREEEEERLAQLAAPTMSLAKYKELWKSLQPSGSFQCKLKSPPSLQIFSDHMRKQKFHVVFETAPKAGEIEVGVCNVRESGSGPWFMARFLASANSFSAVMKCEDPESVAGHVKKFALAKVLKIDTST